ncbi:hypothetical protein KAR91_47655 [Candidatus Pacearchaeota archaeon]|nr:hypothetical protein [Candidatus Pacearchaeota archaeon]
MKIYNYDPDNFELTNEREARKSPLDKTIDILPASATFIAPPVLSTNQQAVFEIDLQQWFILDDYRLDTSYFDNTTGEIIEFELGQAPNATMSQTFPAAAQTAIDEAKRKQDIRNEGLRRIQAMFPFFKDIEDLDFIKEFWLSIAPAARQPTVNFQMMIDIYTTAKTAITDGTELVEIVWP